MAPVNLLESVPPNVISPFTISTLFVGSKETPISSFVVMP